MENGRESCGLTTKSLGVECKPAVHQPRVLEQLAPKVVEHVLRQGAGGRSEQLSSFSDLPASERMKFLSQKLEEVGAKKAQLAAWRRELSSKSLPPRQKEAKLRAIDDLAVRLDRVATSTSQYLKRSNTLGGFPIPPSVQVVEVGRGQESVPWSIPLF